MTRSSLASGLAWIALTILCWAPLFSVAKRTLPLIEASPSFAEATFFAPTSRLPGGQGDRFHLETRLQPVERPKP